MVNTCELLINVVKRNEPTVLIGSAKRHGNVKVG